jgi:hypothetical protein
MTLNKNNSPKTRNNSIEISKNKIFIVKTVKSGKEITCLKGTVWITQRGDGKDRILKCGDIFQTSISNKIIIQALDQASINVASMDKVKVIGNFPSRIQPNKLSMQQVLNP